MARVHRFINLKKALVYTVVINALQIAGAVTLALLSLLTGGHAFVGLPEQVLMCTMTLIVSWGAALDIREAFSTRRMATEADMLEEAYDQLGDSLKLAKDEMAPVTPADSMMSGKVK